VRDRDPRPRSSPCAPATVLIATDAVPAVLGIEADDTCSRTERARELAARLADRSGSARVALTRREILGPAATAGAPYCTMRRPLVRAEPAALRGLVDRVGRWRQLRGRAHRAARSGGDAPAGPRFRGGGECAEVTVPPATFSAPRVREVEELLRTDPELSAGSAGLIRSPLAHIRQIPESRAS